MKNQKDECLENKRSGKSAINVEVNDVSYKDTHPAGYCHDKEIGIDRSSWMIHLKDERCMSGLSLPGTHDTMSFYGGDIVACQTASLKTQLESGIRVLDIRCCEEKGKFVIYHGPVFQKATFDDVLDTIYLFLRQKQNYRNKRLLIVSGILLHISMHIAVMAMLACTALATQERLRLTNLTSSFHLKMEHLLSKRT